MKTFLVELSCMEISILPIACWKQSIQTENLPITLTL